MKNIIITLALFFFTVTSFSQNGNSEGSNKEKINWMSISEALEKNKENPKKIFVDVYTDWCGWCKKMDKTTFREPEVVEVMNKYFYPVKFDAESAKPVEFNGKVYKNTKPDKRRHAHQLASALLRNKLSYPSYVLLDGNNNGLTVLKGYMKKKQLMPVLKFIGQDLHKEMKWKEYKKQQGM
ncbi:MAG: DUF255 domain-containing protein [Bacteroidales bacterium]|nr:DUF255 domain-containing protein [Bacteroidales bacterium]MCF8334656.1 DUF255 domain-containing protein [Bacteroidales bacterium]